jgi:hypothetical protein
MLELCRCGSGPQCWTSARCDAAGARGVSSELLAVCVRERIQGRLKNSEYRREFAVGDAGGLLLDGCNRGIVLGDGCREYRMPGS